jgi:ring-1,2-phenylacetyl-CoA epoxidase subunit PaaC
MAYAPEAALDGPTVTVPEPPDYAAPVRAALFDWCVRTGDDALILGHRLSEWCGHAPMLEEDLALPNMALDLIGQARVLYAYAGALEGKGRDEDAFAYLREEREFRNLRLVARPNGDFAHTMLRQLHFAAFAEPMWRAAEGSADPTVAGLAAKARKEMAYHVRHSAEWVIRLGDGTEESARRMAEAAAALAPFVGEMFETDAVTETLAAEGLAPDPAALRAAHDATLAAVFEEARLEAPEATFPLSGGRRGMHGEELGHLLAELQYVARAHPGARW